VLIDFKRVEGVSKELILKMVRAGEGTFTDEIQNAGFDLIERREDMFDDKLPLAISSSRRGREAGGVDIIAAVVHHSESNSGTVVARRRRATDLHCPASSCGTATSGLFQ
jgi:hypothetical protein